MRADMQITRSDGQTIFVTDTVGLCQRECEPTLPSLPHCDTSLGGVYEERAAGDRERLCTEEVTADEVVEVAASARAARRAEVAGGSGGSP